jgi:hypothetical protein
MCKNLVRTEQKIAVPNSFEKIEALPNSKRQDTREAVRAGLTMIVCKGADLKLIFEMKKLLMISISYFCFFIIQRIMLTLH